MTANEDRSLSSSSLALLTANGDEEDENNSNVKRVNAARSIFSSTERDEEDEDGDVFHSVRGYRPSAENEHARGRARDNSTDQVAQQTGEESKTINIPNDELRANQAAIDSERQLFVEAPDDASHGRTAETSTYGEGRTYVRDKFVADPYGDQGRYTGVVLTSTGMPHGEGKMIYREDNRTYEGDWRHGRWHGFGSATFANGDHYRGEYRYDQRHGRGVYRWSDGRVFDGIFREDKRHGKGRFIWPDGAEYDGFFVSGQREGQGVYKFSDGGRYEGGWKDGRYHGWGICSWRDGRTYRGEWLNGMAHGKGKETFADGSVRHDGLWIEDEPVNNQ